MKIEKPKIIDRAALLSIYSYRNSTDEYAEYLSEIKVKFPSLKMILSTDESEIEEISDHHYKCDVWRDNNSKTMIFANVGTRLGSGRYETRLVDLYNDIQVVRGRLPDKTSSVIALNKYILSVLKGELGFILPEWTFEYTGYSLGGHMANIGATDMFIRTKNLQISTIVFDEIGAKKSMERICLNNNFDIEQLKIEFMSIRLFPNLVNEFQLQIKKHIIYRLDFDNIPSCLNLEKEELYNKIVPKFSYLYKLFSGLLSYSSKSFESVFDCYEKKVFQRLFNQLEEDGIFYTYYKLQYCHQIFLDNFLSKKTNSVNAIDSGLYDIIEGKISIGYDEGLLKKYQEKEKSPIIQQPDVFMKLLDGSYKAMSSQIIYDLVDKDNHGIPLNLVRGEIQSDEILPTIICRIGDDDTLLNKSSNDVDLIEIYDDSSGFTLVEFS
jgi:hypothetical protein